MQPMCLPCNKIKKAIVTVCLLYLVALLLPFLLIRLGITPFGISFDGGYHYGILTHLHNTQLFSFLFIMIINILNKYNTSSKLNLVIYFINLLITAFYLFNHFY